MGAAERPEREGERGEQAVEQRQRKLGRMQRRRDRQRHDGAERRGDARTAAPRRATSPIAAPTADEQQHLPEIDREHAAAGRAERLQRRDHVALAVEMALHRVGDADAADQQRGQADQREELGEALDVALQRRRGVGAGADLPAGVGKLRARPPRSRRCAARSLPSGSRRR